MNALAELEADAMQQAIVIKLLEQAQKHKTDPKALKKIAKELDSLGETGAAANIRYLAQVAKVRAK